MSVLRSDVSSQRRHEIREADLLSIIGKYNDVTERLRRSHDALGREVCRLREELEQKNKELQRRERLAALGEMAAGVAHEIRNPLGAIHLYASLLERDLADRPAQLDLVKRLEVGIVNLEGIVGDILAFSGELEPRARAVVLGDILAEVLSQTRPAAERREVTVTVDRGLSSAVLFCDAVQIQRALVNLVMNAVEAVDRGGRVWLDGGPCAGRAGGGWPGMYRLRVTDDGPGIDPAHLQRVFNPFFTTKHTGTGLGLAIVHRIAEANGGSVQAANGAGRGASFVLTLPSDGPSAESGQAAEGVWSSESRDRTEACV
jgi:two-component system sensor histidine kinase HydH